MMQHKGAVTVSTPSDREIAISREFNATRDLVWRAYTEPELLKRWMGIPEWPWVECEMDVRVDGKYRYQWRSPDGSMLMGVRGVYNDVKPLDRMVSTERFDDQWYAGDCVGRVEFIEQRGKTLVLTTLKYDSKDIRDNVLKSPMKEGMELSFDRLDGVLASLAS